jgi:ABC-type phosphate/phosphonate transport system substrate-binding protein
MKVRSMVAIAAGFALVTLAVPAPGKQKQQEAIKIGVADSMLRDLSAANVDTLLPELERLVLEHAGLKNEIVKAGSSSELAEKLKDKTVQLGVFYGFEFAWARQSYPELKPLIIAVQRQRSLKALVVVAKENQAASIADLKRSVLSIPGRCPEHCRLFLERELTFMGADQKDFFSKTVVHPTSEDALDDILRGKVQAVLVDGIGLDVYKQVNPGRYARLKILKSVEGFPASVLAYREGGLDEATLVKLKKSLVSANTTAGGKQQLVQLNLSAFENVPADYESMLVDILKRYPAPPK